MTIARPGMASRAGGAKVGTSALDLLSAAVEHAEGGIAELATARASRTIPRLAGHIRPGEVIPTVTMDRATATASAATGSPLTHGST